MEGKGIMRDKLSKQKEKFLEYIKSSGKFSENTVSSYNNDVEKFLNFLRSEKINDLTKADEKVALRYYEKLKKELKDRSVMRNLSSLRKFYDFLCESGSVKMNSNPFKCIKHESKEKEEPRVLNIAEISKFFRSLGTGSFLDSRDRAMILFIYGTGLRASEVAEAKINRLDLENAVYVLKTGKNKKVVPFSKRIVPALRDYIEYRNKLLKKAGIKKYQNRFLFINIRGERITRQTVYIVVQKRAEIAGLGKNVTPSVLRNSLAFHLLGSGTSGEVVKEFLRYTTLLPKYERIPNFSRTKFEYLSTHPAFKKR